MLKLNVDINLEKSKPYIPHIDRSVVSIYPFLMGHCIEHSCCFEQKRTLEHIAHDRNQKTANTKQLITTPRGTVD
jgi:hypothetical protein